jgi:hypothetical protein
MCGGSSPHIAPRSSLDIGLEDKMKSGFNPTRRNRNIGTATQGHGQNNRLGDVWTAQLHPHRRIDTRVRSRDITLFVENTTGGCVHACTKGDIRRILEHLPFEDWRGMTTFVLRQPTRSQRSLNPAWGRMFYQADFGLSGPGAHQCGPAIFLEAMVPDKLVKWPASLRPNDRDELERLCEDGHTVAWDGRHHFVGITQDSVRNTQLFRTFLHEIGHWVDFVEKVVRPAEAGHADRVVLAEAYFARADDEREVFAHRYADKIRTHLTRFGIIPFDRIDAL